MACKLVLSICYNFVNTIKKENPLLWKVYYSKLEKNNPFSTQFTPQELIGPAFKFGSPIRKDHKLYKEEELHPSWPKLYLSGHVYDEDRKPIPNAILNFWQSNSDGYYSIFGDAFRGKIECDMKGRYEVYTVLPGIEFYILERLKNWILSVLHRMGFKKSLNLYFHRAPHIHVQVLFGDGKVFTTQLYCNYENIPEMQQHCCSMRDIVSDLYKIGKQPLLQNILKLERIGNDGEVSFASTFDFVIPTKDIRPSLLYKFI